MKSYVVSPTIDEHYWTGRLSLLGRGASTTPEITTCHFAAGDGFAGFAGAECGDRAMIR